MFCAPALVDPARSRPADATATQSDHLPCPPLHGWVTVSPTCTTRRRRAGACSNTSVEIADRRCAWSAVTSSMSSPTFFQPVIASAHRRRAAQRCYRYRSSRARRAVYLGCGPAFVHAESHGLRWLGETTHPRPPVRPSATTPTGPPCLPLWSTRRPGSGPRRALRRSLAALHRFGAARFGLDADNLSPGSRQVTVRSPATADTLLSLASSTPASDRIQLRLSVAPHLAPTTSPVGRLEALSRSLRDRPHPPLLSDLLSGNAIVERRRSPRLVDRPSPAATARSTLPLCGSRGFGERVHSAYTIPSPRSRWAYRVPLHPSAPSSSPPSFSSAPRPRSTPSRPLPLTAARRATTDLTLAAPDGSPSTARSTTARVHRHRSRSSPSPTGHRRPLRLSPSAGSDRRSRFRPRVAILPRYPTPPGHHRRHG